LQVAQRPGLDQDRDLRRLSGAALADGAMADIAVVQKDLRLIAHPAAKAASGDLRCPLHLPRLPGRYPKAVIAPASGPVDRRPALDQLLLQALGPLHPGTDAGGVLLLAVGDGIPPRHVAREDREGKVGATRRAAHARERRADVARPGLC